MPRRSRQRGFVLIAMSVAMVVLLGMVGLAFDLGRIYIARNEAQVFTDAASMTAAARLDGSASGIDAARRAVAQLPMRWNLGTQPFTGVFLEFSADRQRWELDPRDPAPIQFVRVTAPANDVEITFLRAVGAPDSLTVPASSVSSPHPVRLVE